MSYRSTAQSDNSDNSINAPFEDNQTQTDLVSLHSDRESTTKSVEPRNSHLSYTSADYASGIPVQQATGVPLEKSKAIGKIPSLLPFKAEIPIPCLVLNYDCDFVSSPACRSRRQIKAAPESDGPTRDWGTAG